MELRLNFSQSEMTKYLISKGYIIESVYVYNSNYDKRYDKLSDQYINIDIAYKTLGDRPDINMSRCSHEISDYRVENVFTKEIKERILY